MSTRTWRPTVEESTVRLFINYKLFGVFCRSIADTIVKGMVGVKEVDYASKCGCNYMFIVIE